MINMKLFLKIDFFDILYGRFRRESIQGIIKEFGSWLYKKNVPHNFSFECTLAIHLEEVACAF